ncbi:lipase [Penicillium canariense]|uniref:Lipase n=1 Tax=Penicillium canariense TaxID=189055 RepID=A0A9W9LMZ4_9EURO|nr:lipase [Penicillium canariense]KAJ5166631.1 lipase [Penicillium canariense]
MKGSYLVQVGLAYGAAVASLAVLNRRTSAVANTSLINTLANAAGDHEDIGGNASNALSAIVAQLQQAGSITAPDSVEEALATLQQAVPDGPASTTDVAEAIAEAGLVPADILSFLNGYMDSELNSVQNTNPAPTQTIYPSKGPDDAPYSVPEQSLRAAIYIPETFGYGRNGKTPVLLVPGTAIPAGTTYHYSFSKLGDGAPVDVVWLNIPHASLSDAQVNAEYVAYAINYIAAQTNHSLAVLTWSQGALDTQWALKYWPSTRPAVQDFIAISPDFHGTVVGTLACPALTYLICTPSLFQQAWNATFIATLRSDGGDSAYVPTTTIFSAFDEIVQPQVGPDASAHLGDIRGVGVTNALVQDVCAGQPAAGFYTHEGVLYNPLAWALALDAIAHDGPGSVSRVDLKRVCAQVLAPQLGLGDVLGTEGLLLVAVAELLAYQPRNTGEPAIEGYAANGSRAGR